MGEKNKIKKKKHDRMLSISALPDGPDIFLLLRLVMKTRMHRKWNQMHLHPYPYFSGLK
jgi:hypothetical protein